MIHFNSLDLLHNFLSPSQCYRRTLQVAIENNIKNVVLCCVSCGVYAFPQEPAARIAISTIRSLLEEPSIRDKINTVSFCVFARHDVEIYRKLMPIYFPLPADTVKNAATQILKFASTQSESDKEKGKEAEETLAEEVQPQGE